MPPIPVNPLDPFAVKLMPFIFSTTQPYVLQFSGGEIRAYADDGVVSIGLPAGSIPSPYAIGDLASISRAQSADVLFLACGQGGGAGTGYPLATLERLGANNFQYSTLPLRDGPYISLNTNPATTLTPTGIATTPVTGTGAGGANVIELTVGDTSQFTTGQNITVSQVGGTIEANGQWIATVIDSTHINLQGSAYENAWTSGGNVYGIAGNITLTASQAAGINNDQGFLSTDVGRSIRFLSGDGSNTAWIWIIINGVLSPTSITGTVQPATTTSQGVPQGTQQSADWQLGAFSATLGFPYVVALWQERLILFGNANQPNAVWCSVSGQLDLFGPTLPDGTVTPQTALYFVIDSSNSNGQINAARWISMAGSAQSMQLALGTAGSEEILQPASQSEALSSTNIQVYQETAFGSAPNVPVLRIGKAVLFADQSARKLLEWVYNWQFLGYIARDKTSEAEHITRGMPGSDPSTWGIRELAYQQSPYRIIWGVRNDGTLIGFTYDYLENVWAPHEHQLGGQYYGGPPIVESIAVIPSQDQTYDELWLSVLRTIDGTPQRFIEVMTRFFDAQPIDQAWFVDAAATNDLVYPAATLTVTGLSVTPPLPGTNALTMPVLWTGLGTFTASAAAFNGNSADIGLVIRVNGGKAIVTAPIDTMNVTAQVIEPLLNLQTAASGAWSATAPMTSFTGLTWTGSETVAVLGDGEYFGQQQAIAGSITLSGNGASQIVAGFPYTPVLVTMPFEAPRAAAALTGRVKRVVHLYLRLYETVSCWFGRRVTDPQTYAIADNALPFEFTPSPGTMFTGISRLDTPGAFDREGQVIVTQDGPLPLTVLSINATVEAEEHAPAGRQG